MATSQTTGGMDVVNVDVSVVVAETAVFQHVTFLPSAVDQVVAEGTIVAFDYTGDRYVPWVPAVAGTAPTPGTADDPVGVIASGFTGGNPAADIGLQMIASGSQVRRQKLAIQAGGAITDEGVAQLGANGIVVQSVPELNLLDNQ